jgi:hypothetical protein
MPDNWAFVVAAYALAAVVLAGYWRFLIRRAHELDDAAAARQHLRQRPGASEPRPAQRGPSP